MMRWLKARRRLRLFLCAFLAAFLFVFVWYALGRATSAGRTVRVFDCGAGSDVAVIGEVSVDGLFRVVAYNIAHGRGVGDSNWSESRARDNRLSDIASLLREFDADVVVLNEVDFSSIWSGHQNQAELIAEEAGYRYLVEQMNIDMTSPFATLRFGNAVLSRHPIKKVMLIDLPGYAGWETLLAGKKRAVLCEIELADGSRLHVVGAHFDTRGDESIRVDSARALAKVVGELESPVVIAGDLNSTPSVLPGARLDSDSRTAVDVLVADCGFSRAAPGRATDEVAGTFPSWEPTRTIDWVLVNGSGELKHMEVYDSDLSDHLPVVADIHINHAR